MTELTNAKEMVHGPDVTHKNHYSSSDRKVQKDPARDMSVAFPEGMVIVKNGCRNSCNYRKEN